MKGLAYFVSLSWFWRCEGADPSPSSTPCSPRKAVSAAMCPLLSPPSCIQLCWCTHTGWKRHHGSTQDGKEAPRDLPVPWLAELGDKLLFGQHWPRAPLPAPFPGPRQERRMLCPEAAHCTPIPSDTHPSRPAAREHPTPPRVPYKVCVLWNTKWILLHFHARLRGCCSFPGGSAPPGVQGCRQRGHGTVLLTRRGFPERQETAAHSRDTGTLFTAGSQRADAAPALPMAAKRPALHAGETRQASFGVPASIPLALVL